MFNDIRGCNRGYDQNGIRIITWGERGEENPMIKA